VIRRAVALLVAAAAASAASAQNVVSSRGPERVAVTLYRADGRSPSPNQEWLEGYALVTETRTVTLPAGESELRFEGVAGGIVPQSAIVAGFPEGIVERNRDAMLLSPETLLDRSLGRRVEIRRTSLATGRVTETNAIIRSGADGAVILQTREGNEALRCTGLPETLVYDSLPGGLSARPTLSVRTRAARPVTATVTLAYLATGFDWQANYVADLSPDGTSIDLLAWLTLGSSDETSFVNADIQAVAGRVNREYVEPQPREGGPLELRCWPAATTSDIPLEQLQQMDMGRGRTLRNREETIIVRGSRIGRPNLESMMPITSISASQEDLGDLKLYRIPEPVTLAARSQKQVAFLTRERVRVRVAYRRSFQLNDVYDTQAEPAMRVMLTRNREAEGLGVPLPAGGLVLFGPGPDRPLLLGEGWIGDRAVGEDVEISLGASPGVASALRMLGWRNGVGRFEATVSNDQPYPVAFESELFFGSVETAAPVARRNGRPFWSVTIPANSRATLCFSAAVPEANVPRDRLTADEPCTPAD
jgi:hypothetical protein